MMMEKFPGRPAALLALMLALALGSCERSPSARHERDLDRVELIDRLAPGQPVVAVWQAGTGWTGALPPIELGSPQPRLSLGVRMFTGGTERVLSLGGPYSARWRLAGGAQAGIVAADETPGPRFHGDHVDIYGVGRGTTQIQFMLWHFDHDDGATQPIQVEVR
jgi:hypothetical protein